MVLDNSSIKSYNSYFHWTILQVVLDNGIMEMYAYLLH